MTQTWDLLWALKSVGEDMEIGHLVRMGMLVLQNRGEFYTSFAASIPGWLESY